MADLPEAKRDLVFEALVDVSGWGYGKRDGFATAAASAARTRDAAARTGDENRAVPPRATSAFKASVMAEGDRGFDAATGRCTGANGLRKEEGIADCKGESDGMRIETERDTETSERNSCMARGDCNERGFGGLILFLGANN